jgi:hypothetical protein
MKTNRPALTYEKKLLYIKDILQDLAKVSDVFASLHLVVVLQPQPSEAYLDSCYNMVYQLQSMNEKAKADELVAIHEKLAAWEDRIREEEAAYEAKNNNADQILESL